MNPDGNGRLQLSYWLQLFYLLWAIFTCAFVMTMVSIFVIKAIYKVSLTDITVALSTLNSNPQAVMPAKIIQLISSIGTFVLPPFVFLAFRRQSSFQYLRMERLPSLKFALMGILLVFFSIPLLSLIIEANKQMALPDFLKSVEDWMRIREDELEKMTKVFLQMNSVNDLLLNMLMIAVVPALGEELLFRGVGQRFFAEWTRNIHWGIWISAAIFSAIHLQFYGFVPRMLLGALLGYMFYWSGNLWVPILAHFFNNGSQVLLVYLYQRGMVETNIDEVETFPLYMTVIFSALFAAVIYKFYKSRTE